MTVAMSQPPFMEPPPEHPARRSWWSRNWKWVVPLGVVAPILACGGFIGILVTVIFSVMKGSVAYTESVAAVRADPAVVAALGTPIEEGLPRGNIEVNGATGYADLAIPISGPRGDGTIYVSAEKRRGQWHFTTLQVQTDDQQWFDLLAGAEP